MAAMALVDPRASERSLLDSDLGLDV